MIGQGIISCHELARACYAHVKDVDPRLQEPTVGLRVVDGHFGYPRDNFTCWPHSWLQYGLDWIIDPYCIGATPMVQIRDRMVYGKMYLPNAPAPVNENTLKHLLKHSTNLKKLWTAE